MEDADKFDKLGWGIEDELVGGQPVVVKACVLLANLTDDVVNQVVHQVFKVSNSRMLPLLVCQ